MPLMGLFAAFLANSVPIGGGIIYIPVLYLIDNNMKLGVAFTVSTMTFGNGVLGFLRWYIKDRSLIIWDSFVYSVLSSSLGTIIAFLTSSEDSESASFTKRDESYARTVFALLCLKLSIVIALASYRGGLENVLSLQRGDGIYSNMMKKTELTLRNKIALSLISLAAGYYLVPYIGIGPALTTFITLQVQGFDAKSAIVTGIITGGWVAIVPFLLHLFYYRDVPFKLWVMVLPGVYFGAKFSPYVHDYLGLNTILQAFALFLLLSSLLFFM